MSKMVNIAGRTKKQQKNVDAALKSSGSIWPKLPIFYKFIYTKKQHKKLTKYRTKMVTLEAKIAEIETAVDSIDPEVY